MDRQRSLLVRIIGLVLLGGLLAYYIPRIEWTEMKVSIQSADFSYLVLAIPGLFVLWLMRSAYLWILMEPLKIVGYWEIFKTNQIGFMIDQILPARSGYFYRWAVFTAKAKNSKSYIASALIASLGVEGLILILLFLVGMLMTKSSGLAVSPASALILAGVLVGSTFFLLSSNKIRSLVDKTPLRKIGIIRSVFDLTRLIRSPQNFSLLMGANLIAWSAQIWIFIALGSAFQMQIGIFQAIVVMLVLHLAIVVPIVPGNVGTVQLAVVWSLTQMHFDKEPAIALSLVFHAFHALSGIFLGSLLWLSNTAARIRFRREEIEDEDEIPSLSSR